jgi:CDP-diacylglycerol--serine O-phosphatidyltransferase
MKWTKEIPNLITMSNMACGLLGIGFVISGQEWMGFVMMIAGAALDFFDGFAARKLGVAGEMGKQLDSMADVVTFGVLPGLIWKAMMEYQGYCPADRFCINGYTWLLIPLAAGYRLAKFNIDQRQTTGFYGIPTPITGLVLGSFAWMSYNLGHPGDLWFIDNPVIDIRPILNHFWVWLYMPLLTAYMMVSDLPMLAMKFGVNDPLRKFKLLLVALAVPCVLFGSAGVAVFYFLYIFVSLLANFAIKSN